MTVTKGRATYSTELSGEVFGETLEGKDYIKALCPDIDPSLCDDLVEACESYGWGRIKDYDEHLLFLANYMQIKHQVYREAVEIAGDFVGGLSAFTLYDRYQKIVEACILKVTNWGDITGEFMGPIARTGTEQWFVRQIDTDTFWFGATQSIPPAAHSEALNAIGTAQLLVPRRTVGGTALAVNDEQMFIIFYYRSDLNPRSLDYIQEEVNDDWGVRPVMNVYSQLQRGNMGIITRHGCLIVDDNNQYECHGMPLDNVACDFMPQGIDLTTRNVAVDLTT